VVVKVPWIVVVKVSDSVVDVVSVIYDVEYTVLSTECQHSTPFCGSRGVLGMAHSVVFMVVTK
jgi:hypothetical protein